MIYKIVKNGQSVISDSLTKEEAIKQLAIIADDCAMATNHYLTDEKHTITDPDSKRVIFKAGEENAIIGDNSFEIVKDND